MGYLGFCYVESKSFEFRSEVSGGVQLAKRSRCIFRAVFLRWPSLFWLMQAMEGFIKGDDSNENWRTYRQGSTAYMGDSLSCRSMEGEGGEVLLLS